MTHKERILDYLWSIAPNGATNDQIRDATNIRSQQQVYLLTQELARTGFIWGERRGRRWFFGVDESPAVHLASPGRAPQQEVTAHFSADLSARDFEDLARAVMSAHLAVPLAACKIAGVSKEFDIVSPDQDVVGDAIYFTLARGQRLPPAKFSIITERVWLLEKTDASTRFLIFGNDRRAPLLWLARYGHLLSDVIFYFLTDDGELELLATEIDRKE